MVPLLEMVSCWLTTKGGTKNQKPIFNIQGSYAFSKPTQELFADRWDAIDDLDYQNAVARFQGTPLPNGEESMPISVIIRSTIT